MKETIFVNIYRFYLLGLKLLIVDFPGGFMVRAMSAPWFSNGGGGGTERAMLILWGARVDYRQPKIKKQK